MGHDRVVSPVGGKKVGLGAASFAWACEERRWVREKEDMRAQAPDKRRRKPKPKREKGRSERTRRTEGISDLSRQ
jgi:hypothetical protein